MSSAEMLAFVTYAGVIFGDLIPEGHECWELFILVREIMSILFSNYITLDTCTLLRTVIEEHHSIFLNRFQQTFKPKHHHMIHYPYLLQKVGPLINLWCMRFEAKHKQSKSSANVVTSRINLPRTLALKHQLQFCNRLLRKNGFENKITLGKSHNFENVSQIIPNFNTYILASTGCFQSFESNVFNTKNVAICSTVYKINNVVLIDMFEFPLFGVIKYILVDSMVEEVCFVCETLETIAFNRHYQAYQVQKTNGYLCVNQKDMYHYKPVLKSFHPSGQYFVTCLL